MPMCVASVENRLGPAKALEGIVSVFEQELEASHEKEQTVAVADQDHSMGTGSLVEDVVEPTKVRFGNRTPKGLPAAPGIPKAQ